MDGEPPELDVEDIGRAVVGDEQQCLLPGRELGGDSQDQEPLGLFDVRHAEVAFPEALE
jgi:hypothetical protein